MKEFLRRLRFLFRRSAFERELEEEMQHHLALKAENTASLEEAARQFGNVALLKENSRSMWTFVFWEQLAQDIRYGVRAMRGNKLFTAMAVLSLALGIGANTAIYSFMDAILMRRLPVPKPEELVVLNWSTKNRPPVVHGVNGSMWRDAQHGRISPNFPWPAFETLRNNGKLPTAVFAYARAYELNVVVSGRAEVSKGMYVSGGYYRELGVPPALGRLIADPDDRAGSAAVAVLSYDYWQTHFASRPDAVGSQILVNNTPFTVIGVSRPGFFGVSPGHESPVTIPLHAMPLFAPDQEIETRRRFFDQNFYWVEMMGRLQPGATMPQAEAALRTAFSQYVKATATSEKERTGEMPSLWLQEGRLGLDSLRRQYSKPLFVLMAMVGLILAIACANIANLLLSRATARRREMAVRMSLGAGRGRVIRQLLTESVLLSCTGGLLGLGVAVWGIRSIVWLLSRPDDDLTLHAGLNWPVLAFTFALAVGTGIIFGLAPALQATGRDVTPALKETRSSAVTGRRRFGFSAGIGHALVVTQVAISLVLAVAAGLFVRTLSGLNAIELGFNRDNILVFTLNAKRAGYKEEALAAFYANLADRFRAIPGVRIAAMSDMLLVSQHWNDTTLTIPGSPAPPDKKPSTALVRVDAGFLPVMQIPVLLGRGIEPRDMRSPRVAVVTELFAKKFFNGENPVGQRIGLHDTKAPADIEIIGVAKTTRYNSLREDETPPLVYIPYTQDMADLGRVNFELRTDGNPLALAGAVRTIVHDASPTVPVTEITTQSSVIDQTIAEQRTFANLCTGFAVLALLIACVGLYGTMAYAVARRTNEIGIRMALGAKRGGIIWMVLSQVAVLSVIGLAIGLGIAWQAGHFVASFLYGVKPTDAVVMTGAAATLIAAAVAAGFGPAWRASKIDPMAALRHE